jgi:hypothetical protein
MGEPNDRRSEDRNHDTLIRIDANLSNFMKRFDEHSQDDKDVAAKVDKRLEKLDEGQDFLKRYLWIGMGVLAAVEFFAHKIFK